MDRSTVLGIDAEGVLRTLGSVAGMLLAVHLGCQFLAALYGPNFAKSAIAFFDVNRESNLPSIYSALLFALNAGLFYCTWLASRADGNPQRLWQLLAVVFLFLGIDEICAIHERLTAHMRQFIPGSESGVSRAWLVPYGIGAAGVGVFAWPVVRDLGVRLCCLMALAGVLFVTGAVALEFIGGLYLNTTPDADSHRPVYVVLYTVEEALEMAGLITLVYTLLVVIREKFGVVTLVLGVRPKTSTAVAQSAPARPAVINLPPATT